MILKNFFNSKKAIVSFNTFVLILLIALILFFASYDFYNESKISANDLIYERENVISLISFRAALISVLSYNSSNLTYENTYDSENIEIYFSNNSLRAERKTDFRIVETNITLLGINFCQAINFSPVAETKFYFNGTCVSKLT